MAPTKKNQSEEKIIKTTLRVPRSVWTAARIRGLEEGVSVQDLVVKAIQSYLKGGR
jgi:predicted HicB family RNase H-like nuclease